ncbi:MAG: T9SS type A sorting domain-containing protein [Bacteroidetes bacterium]|nr:T9SS type A sorting domain-containing protein [Bacteroidota bacterium]HET6245950.1 choice-of-anchor V domain-containing protein [Bacteroidia bacterium]
MKRYTILTIFFLSILAISFDIIEPFHGRKSAGPAVYSTGAPGEGTCASVGCHNDLGGPNIGTGLSVIDVNSGISEYAEGDTLNIKIKISQSAFTRFGFQVVALSNNNNLNTGTWVLSDTNATQTAQPTFGNYQDRIYVQHTASGIDFASDEAEWSFKWIAPSENTGNITFYAATLSADSDTYKTGDYTYTSSLQINPISASSLNREGKLMEMKIYPNPARDKITVSGEFNTSDFVLIRIIDFSGKVFKSEKITPISFSQLEISVIEVPKGIYFLEVIYQGEPLRKKILILN